MNMEKQTEKLMNKGIGFTSYSNDHITCNCISDHLFRFKMILESHMGSRGMALVKLKTIAKEMGKNPRSASRCLKWFLEHSNLRVKKIGYIYEYFTLPDTSVMYGRTHVSHISVHGCPHIKRLQDKDLNKRTIVSFKEDLKERETLLVDEITEWVTRPEFHTLLNEKQVRLRVIGALKKCGYDGLKKAYKSIAYFGGDPHPKRFWELVNEITNI